MELLPKEAAPSGQHRHNVFVFLAGKINGDFGYCALNYGPAFEDAADKMLAWWQENRQTFALRDSGR